MDDYSDLYYVEEQHKKHFCKKCGKEMEKRFTHMTEEQKTLYYIAENMKMQKSISKDGYKHFQKAIASLQAWEKVIEEIKTFQKDLHPIEHDNNYESIINEGQDLALDYVLDIIKKYLGEVEE